MRLLVELPPYRQEICDEGKAWDFNKDHEINKEIRFNRHDMANEFQRGFWWADKNPTDRTELFRQRDYVLGKQIEELKRKLAIAMKVAGFTEEDLNTNSGDSGL